MQKYKPKTILHACENQIVVQGILAQAIMYN